VLDMAPLCEIQVVTSTAHKANPQGKCSGACSATTAFRGPQRRIVEHVIAGGSALVLNATGGGKKSALFIRWARLFLPGLAVVISTPLIALMQDQRRSPEPGGGAGRGAAFVAEC